MSRFLFATIPSDGHVGPLRPIARALVAAGHTVEWFVSTRYKAAVESTGAEHIPTGPSLDRFDADQPDREGLTGLAAIRWDLKYGFLAPVPAQVAEVRDLLRTRPVDALVADMGFVGAGPVHELTGVPWISVGISPLPLPSRDTAPFGTGLKPSASPLGRLRNRALYALLDRLVFAEAKSINEGIRADLGLPFSTRPVFSSISPLLHIQNGVRELEYPRSDLPPQVRFVGALVDRGSADAALPAWWPDVVDAGRPIVHVTQGTVANRNLDDLVKRAVRVLADDDVLVVASTGDADPADLGALPTNVRAAAFVPHDALMPHTSIMVTNGGFGGVQTALSHGVPLVVAGATEDKPEVAARIAWAGAGINLRSNAPKDRLLLAAVRRVRTDPRYRAGATRLRDAIRRHDTAAEVTALAEAVVAGVPLPVL